MHDFVHKPMGIYLVVWYLQSGVIVVIKSIKIILFSFNSVNGVARILIFGGSSDGTRTDLYHPARSAITYVKCARGWGGGGGGVPHEARTFGE